MQFYTIQEGESAESVAYAHGLFWPSVWDDAANAGLRARRAGPNLLEPGDLLAIPALRDKQAAAATGSRHRFVRKGVPSLIRVRLLEHDTARADVAYTVLLGGSTLNGRSDAAGWIQFPVMPDVGECLLTLEGGESYQLRVGAVGDIAHLRGVQNRLRNLGFYSGPVDGAPSEPLAAALARFQSCYGLRASGQVDAPTRVALAEAHAS